jgi:hypothetical protein
MSNLLVLWRYGSRRLVPDCVWSIIAAVETGSTEGHELDLSEGWMLDHGVSDILLLISVSGQQKKGRATLAREV